MRIESITFQRTKESVAEKGIMVAGTALKSSVTMQIIDESGEVVEKPYNWESNHELAADYDVTRPTFTTFKEKYGEKKLTVGRMACFE